MDYDAIVIGGGPAGLSAGTELAQAKYRVLLLEKESFGGPIVNVEWINGYPRPGEKVAGAMLASELVNAAERSGVEMELADVVAIEPYSSCISVGCADGKAYTASVVIQAGGLQSKKLGVPGEDKFQGKGMIHCAMCDAGLYRDQVVAVCGGGDAGLIEAMHLARFASKVFVIEAQAQLAAKPVLQKRALADAKLEIRYGEKPVEIVGKQGVTGLVVENAASGRRETLDVYGVLVHVGYLPATAYLDGVVGLDDAGRIAVSEQFATDVPGVFAAGDIRSGSPRQVAAAVADGKAAANSSRKNHDAHPRKTRHRRNMIVATAGHIDHGKTSLVKALTGVDTDRLPEERARGISIDLGFAYWPLADGGLIGFVDVPGHERFIHNMLAGVCGIDFALLAVAADDGVMPQTVEHLQILSLLGIRRGVVAITKTDRVDPARVAQVESELHALLATSSLAGIPLQPVSAVTGAGIEPLRGMLAAAAAGHAARYREGQHFRLAIDRAFTVPGSGTIVTGTVFNGEAVPGDRLVLSPSGVPVRVRGIQIRGNAAERVQAGDRCAMNLSGIDVEGVARGDLVLDEAIHAPTQRMDVRITLLATERTALAHWTPLHLHLATADVMARVAIRGSGAIAPGTSARAQLVLDAPVAAVNGDRFILRNRSAARTLGGGTVIDPLAQARRRESSAWLAALEHGTAEAALADLLQVAGQALDCARFEAVFNLSAARAASMYQASDALILGRAPRIAIARAAAAAIRDRILARLGEFHRANAQAPGIDIASLRKELAHWLPADAFSSLVRDLAEARMLEIHGSAVRLPGHDATSNAADEEMWRAVLPALLQARFVAPTIAELARGLGIDEKKLKDFLHRKSKTGEVMRVAEDLFYPKATLATLAANAALVARSASRGLFSAAQYRDATGIGRTRAIKILEFFDTLGITQRIGDTRKMHKNFVPILGAAKPALGAAPAVGKDLRGRRKS